MNGHDSRPLPSVPANPSNEHSDAQWTALGFRNVAAVGKSFEALQSGALQGHRDVLLRSVTHSSDPDQALFSLERWVDAAGSHCEQMRGREPQFIDILARLFAATPALSEYLIRFPERTRHIIQPVLLRQVMGGAAWSNLLRESVTAASSTLEKLAALRRMRVECMLQIAALDLMLISPVQDTVRALSDLADSCIQVALEIGMERLKPRLGIVPLNGGALPFVVFALGKLGGRELNYSSDIDLVFVHSARGETVETTRPVDMQVYFTALGEEIIAALDKLTQDGRVYRVDMRLRPHGSAGSLVIRSEDFLNYYPTEGRTWERQAWLKARAVAGDNGLGNFLLGQLDSFVYRRYLSLDAIGDLQALKRQIEVSVAKRGESEDEVKLGRGGIRDIEFTVQFMQLLHGAEHPSVRSGNTLQALYQLRREGLLTDQEVDPLASAYQFLRSTEHRLQLHGDLQVHKLPQDRAVRRRVALSLGYRDSTLALIEDTPASATIFAETAFENDRLKHTRGTREVFERLFANLFRDNQGPEGELSDLLLAPRTDLDELAKIMQKFGFLDERSSAREMIELGQEKLLLSPPSRTRKFFASVAPQLLKALVATGQPDDALRRFSRIAGSLGAKAVFYQMLSENPWLLKMTADLAAWSEYLTGILVANPGLFDELVDALQTGQSKTMAEMSAELQKITHGPEIADTLRAYKAAELLRIGVRDLIHDASLEQTQAELSDLAEAILRTQVRHGCAAHQRRHGHVIGPSGEPVSFAVLALGKFGGREMNYGSDLDVIFFYGGDGQTTNGQPAVSYFAELAQDLTRTMATPTQLGSLYEMDARLRPNGTKGPLAQSLDNFTKYCKEGQLADWERLALTRARLVAGDEGVGERALHMVRSAVYAPLKNTPALAAEVASMRRRLEESANRDDLKRGSGGIMDIEFIAQYLQLMHGPAFPPLRQANTGQSLKVLHKFGKLPDGDYATLMQAYEFLRRMENRVRVVHGLSEHKLPQKQDALRKLALRAGFADSGGRLAEQILIEDYHSYSKKVRAIFARLVADPSLTKKPGADEL